MSKNVPYTSSLPWGRGCGQVFDSTILIILNNNDGDSGRTSTRILFLRGMRQNFGIRHRVQKSLPAFRREPGHHLAAREWRSTRSTEMYSYRAMTVVCIGEYGTGRHRGIG